MTEQSVAVVMSEAYRLATGNALQPEDALEYLRDPRAFCRLIKSSGALDDPRRRTALERLIVKEKRNGL